MNNQNRFMLKILLITSAIMTVISLIAVSLSVEVEFTWLGFVKIYLIVLIFNVIMVGTTNIKIPRPKLQAETVNLKEEDINAIYARIGKELAVVLNRKEPLTPREIDAIIDVLQKY